MNTQMTTTVGTGGLTASFLNLVNLFGDYTFGEFGQAVASMKMADFYTAVGGVIFSVALIVYNERHKDQNETNV